MKPTWVDKREQAQAVCVFIRRTGLSSLPGARFSVRGCRINLKWVVAVAGSEKWEPHRMKIPPSKRRPPAPIEQKRCSKSTTDEMIAFDCKVIDCGTGYAIVPSHHPGEMWAKYPRLNGNLAQLADAMRGDDSTALPPDRLVYHPAFVHLFNNLERIGIRLERGAWRARTCARSPRPATNYFLGNTTTRGDRFLGDTFDR